MANTPKIWNSKIDHGSESSHSAFKRTVNVAESTPLSFSASRKRKAHDVDNFLSPPHTPQFSSTLNESLMENLEKFNLQNDSFTKSFPKACQKGNYKINILRNLFLIFDLKCTYHLVFHIVYLEVFPVTTFEKY